MIARILVEVSAIPTLPGGDDKAAQEALEAVKEALRVHWKTDLQHNRHSTALLAEFTVKALP